MDLLSFALSCSNLLVLAAALITLTISFLSGAGVWPSVLRSAAAILILGVLLWAINWLLLKGLIRLADPSGQDPTREAVLNLVDKQA